MTGVIKAETAGTLVRQISPAAGPLQAEQAPAVAARSPVELALDEANEEIARLQSTLIEVRQAATRAKEAAHDEGRKAGLAAAAKDDERRTAAVRSGIDQALRAWNDRLAGLDTLAVMLSHSALEKMFGKHGDQAELVARAIAARMSMLRQESLMAIRVSAHDFSDATALERIRRDVGAAVDVRAEPSLGSGECKIDLQLGEIDLGPASQWRMLSAFLEDLVTSGTQA